MPLRWILEQIGAEMADRTALHERVLAFISQQYCYLKTKLHELDAWGLGHNRNIDSRRSRLEQQLDALNQEARQEQVKRWQDVAALKKEFRTWFKQYADLAGRMRLIISPQKSLASSPPPEFAKILHH